jgi:AcrR family transcriptional regulator
MGSESEKFKRMKDRAITPAQKAQRLQVILDAAWDLFQERAYEEIGVATVAKAAGLAKGTLYLYFRTKEELFLTVQEQQLQAWFDDLDRRLRGLAGCDDSGRVAGAICGSLSERPAMTRLLSLLHVILEQNAGYEAVSRFKRMFLERQTSTGELLETCLPFLKAGDGVRLCTWIYILVLGLQPVAHPSPVVREVIAGEPGMGPFDVNFRGECRAVLTTLLEGSRAGARDR